MDPSSDFPEGLPALDFLDMLEHFFQFRILLLELSVLGIQGLVQLLEFRYIADGQLPMGLLRKQDRIPLTQEPASVWQMEQQPPSLVFPVQPGPPDFLEQMPQHIAVPNPRPQDAFCIPEQSPVHQHRFPILQGDQDAFLQAVERFLDGILGNLLPFFPYGFR